jgi:excisionase family DNA binding protein
MLTAQATTGILIPIMTDWLSVTEAAEKSGYSAYHIRELCREGKLETVKKGLMYLIDPESLDDYVAKMKSLGTYKFDWRRKED